MITEAARQPGGDRAGGPSPRRARPLPSFIELFDASADLARYVGRASVCRTVAGMTTVVDRPDADLWRARAAADAATWLDLPGSETMPDATAPDGVAAKLSGGHSWTMVARNQLALAIRSRAFPTVAMAQHDVRQVLARAAEIRLEPVQDATTGLQAIWLMLDDRAIAVSGRTWRRADASLEKPLRRLLGQAVLRTSPTS